MTRPSRLGLPLAVALLALAACRDFSVPTLGSPQDAIQDLDVSPKRVGPGAALTIRFTLGVAGDVAVAVNDRPATRVAASSDRLEYRYDVVGDEGPLLIATVEVALGDQVRTESANAVLDTTAPPAPDPSLLVLEARPPGSSDLLSGKPGALSQAVQVVVALDPAGALPLARAAAAADGSFAALEVGDNPAARLYVLALDDVGNASKPAAVLDDVEGPVLSSLELSPLQPHASLPFKATLRFDEALAAPPEAALAVDGAAVPATVALSADGSYELVATPGAAGTALLTVSASDAAGNASKLLRSFAVGAPVALDAAQVVVARTELDGPAWSVTGLPGAVPGRADVEVQRASPGGAVTICGSPRAGSDGSFAAVPIGSDVAAQERVRVVAFDASGGELGRVELAPDLVPPGGVSLAVAPSVAGPSQPLQIDVGADEPLGPGSTVTVGGAPAQLVAGAGTSHLTFRYAVAGTEASGPAQVAVRAADRSNNAGAPAHASVTLDLSGPEVAFTADGAPWTEPAEPPWSAALPTKVTVAASDPAGVASLSYRLVNVRTGECWDGSAWAGSSLLCDRDVAPATGFDLALKANVPEWERVRLEVRSADGLGNARTAVTHFTSYDDRGWVVVYPAWGASTAEYGGALVARRLGAWGLCAVLFDEDAGKLYTLYSPRSSAPWTKTAIPGVTASIRGGNLTPLPFALEFDATQQHGLVVGEKGLVVRLDSTCQPVETVSGFTDWVDAVAWDGPVAWIAGFEGVFSSADLGRTWTKAPLVAQRWSGIAAVEPGHLVATGQNATVAESLDAGANWTSSQPFGGLPNDLWGVAVGPDGTVHVGGDLLLRFRPKGATTWLAPPSPADQVYGDATFWSVEKIYPTASGTFARCAYAPSADSNYLDYAWLRLSASGQEWSRVVTDTGTYAATASVDDLLPLDNYSLFLAGSAYGEVGLWYSPSGGD